MSTFQDIESGVSGLLCPDCGTCSLSVHLRCDIVGPECTTVATCRHCGREFDAETVPTYQEHFEVSRLAASDACPMCTGSQRVVRWVCNRAAKTCHVLLACEKCGDVRSA